MTTSRFLVCSALLLSLSGCGGLVDTLGLGRNSPDEFAVVDRAPLTVPPNFELRPPKPGAPRPQDVPQEARAASAVFGPDAKVPNTPSAKTETYSYVEQAVLASSGGDKANADIRETIDRESLQKASGSTHLVDDLLWWREGTASGTIVDAPKEAARLKAAKEKGLDPAKGKTPIIERDKGGFLGL